MGVIPIVNENDTLAVSVGDHQLLDTTEETYDLTQYWIGNQIRRQRYPFGNHSCHSQGGLPVLDDRCRLSIHS
jgi:hypothetical protein